MPLQATECETNTTPELLHIRAYLRASSRRDMRQDTDQRLFNGDFVRRMNDRYLNLDGS